MIMLNPTVSGYVLERASRCRNGDWHFVYDAGPQGYTGLKVECITTDLGETISEFYRLAGRVYQSAEAAFPRG
jgi:hypothetical protein